MNLARLTHSSRHALRLHTARAYSKSSSSSGDGKFQFDTYSIFNQLVQKDKYTPQQAIIIMDMFREMISDKIETPTMSQSVSNLELSNENYLFQSACSELKTEIKSFRRQTTIDGQSKIAVLNRNIEILSQQMREELDRLKSHVTVELDARKNSTRQDQRTLGLWIQELNNKITINLISDIKTDVEFLRWQTTRRGLFAIIVVGGLLVTAFFYRQQMAENKEKEKEKTAPPPPPPVAAPPAVATSSVSGQVPVDALLNSSPSFSTLGTSSLTTGIDN